MAHSIEFSGTLDAGDLSLIDFMRGAPATGGGGTPVVNDAAYFPTDPALAKFPSPEDSQILVNYPTGALAAIGGRPYLKDKDGAVHEIRIVNAVAQYFKGGQNFATFPGELVSQCLVRQGTVFMQITGGIWKQVAANGTMYNATLPPPFVPSTTGGTPAVPALPPMPVASAIAPGSSGKIINCGSGQALATLSAGIAAAGAGDKVQLTPGTYTDTPSAWTVPLTVDLGGATFNLTGKTATLARGKALLCPAADSIIQNGTILSVAMDQTEGQMTSAIRPDAGCGYLTVNNIVAHNNQTAIGQGGFPCVIEVNNSDVGNNGLKGRISGGYTHNMYLGSECRRLTLNNVKSIGTNEGHALKFRGPELVINNGTYSSTPGKAIDIPDGATVPFKLTGVTLIKGVNDPDHGILAFGEENNAPMGLAGGVISGGSIVANCANPVILTSGGTITLSNVAKSGNPITASGAGVVNGL